MFKFSVTYFRSSWKKESAYCFSLRGNLSEEWSTSNRITSLNQHLMFSQYQLQLATCTLITSLITAEKYGRFLTCSNWTGEESRPFSSASSSSAKSLDR